ncbi:MAG: precorrin-2 C(20)-methyltransferase [Desulfuromonadia bacterium]
MPPLIHAIGVGPGDPELLTLEGVCLIRGADVIVAPVGRAGGESHALAIVSGHLDPARQEILTIHLPMTADREILTAAWREGAETIISRVEEGKGVVIVTIGDPMLYSTTLYLCREIVTLRPQIGIRYHPGVSSVTASAARGGIPLGIGDERCAIIPGVVTEDELLHLCRLFDTLVFLKISRQLERVVQTVSRLWDDPVTLLVSRVGTGQEQVVTDLSSIAGTIPDYLSTLVVRRTPFHGGAG